MAVAIKLMEVELEVPFKLDFVVKLFSGMEPRPDARLWTIVHDHSLSIRDAFSYLQANARWVLRDSWRGFVRDVTTAVRPNQTDPGQSAPRTSNPE